jgi:hypothetical protein
MRLASSSKGRAFLAVVKASTITLTRRRVPTIRGTLTASRTFGFLTLILTLIPHSSYRSLRVFSRNHRGFIAEG